MIEKKTLAQIRKLQLKMEHIATDLLAGMYRSAFKGRGVEFEEVRPFQEGDDIRCIDWNVTARQGTPFTKLYKEERELTVILAMDISRSLHFGTTSLLKRSLLSEVGGAIAFSGIKNQDKIGLLLFTDKIEHYLPPSKGIKQVLRLIRDLIAFEGKNKGTDIASALHYLGNLQKKRSVIFLLSDFLDKNDYQKAIALIAKKHDLIAIHVEDPLEKGFPRTGLIPLRDLESAEITLIDPKNREVNRVLEKAFLEKEEIARRAIEKGGGEWLSLSTARPYLIDLKKFFLKRGKKR